MFKHDKQGFLIGELISGQKETQAYQQASMNLWKLLRTDVRSIARFLGANSPNSKPATPQRKGAGAAANPTAPRAERAAPAQDPVTGRFISTKPAAPQRSGSRDRQTAAEGKAAPSARTTTTVVPVQPAGRDMPLAAGKDTNVTGAKQGAAPPSRPWASWTGQERGERGRFKSKGEREGGDDSPEARGVGARIADRLSGISTAIQGATAGASQVDPAVAAAQEVKDVVAPLGRGMFALLGRSAEKKKERWYSRILAAITRQKKEEPQPVATSSDAGGGMVGGLVRMLPMLLAGLGTLLAGGLAAFIGTKIGGAIYSWLDKSGLMTKVFDAIDAMRDFVSSALDWLKKSKQEFSDGFDLARAGIGGKAPVLDGSGRNVNDTRRLDVVQQPDTVAAKAGRLMGNVARGVDYATGESSRTASENRALITGHQYRAGNIAGLDDAQTRALVASTVATESGGGNLGVVNKAGYMGRYQAGAGWLADAGLIKGGPESVKAAMKADGFSREYDWGKAGGMTRFLQNDANWKEGMSYGSYLRSADVQDTAFKTNSDKAYAELSRKGVVTPSTPPAEVAGLLKARHLSGMRGAEAVASGAAGSADANGTTARKYFEDVTQDRGGFRAAYAGAAVPTGGVIAMPRAPQVVAASVPSVVPEKMPQPEAVVAPPPAAPEKDKVVRAVMREPIGQDMGDRQIAHIVSGGIGG